MILIQSDTSNNKYLSANDGIIYYYNALPSVGLSSFHDALNLQLWRDYLQPFACALVNSNSQEIILVRDHLGIAPLYYCHYHGKKLIVGQTITDILKHLPSNPPLLEPQINMLFSGHKQYSDETFYQGIYRVEPGHLLHFKADGSIVKKAFWQLEPHGKQLKYADDDEYLEQFSLLMNEAILHATAGHTNIAAEFSAGLDSSAVYCAAVKNNIKPQLYMHVARPGTEAANIYQDSYEKAFIDHYQLTDIKRINEDDFDPLAVFDEYASWFAGPAPYLFFMFANKIHRAVAAGNHPILLSGFGGDQCVSGQLLLNFFLPELLREGKYRQAWHELKGSRDIKKALRYASYMHPALYHQALKLRIMKKKLANLFRPRNDHKPTLYHPYEGIYCRSSREGEWSLIQGPDSHEVRMRIEYSSIVSKKMGFEYRYPLLYPKLLEFILSVPTIQKRRDGNGRYLIRRYLAQELSQEIFANYRKKDGLGIVPSTFELYQQNFKQGCYQQAFKDLPYQHLIHNKNKPIELRNYIKGYMLKNCSVQS